jgi:hypothetical protein
MCNYCNISYRVYNGKPFPKLGWIKPEEQKTIPQHEEAKPRSEIIKEDVESLYDILNTRLGFSFTMGDVRFFLEFLEKQMKMTPLEFRGLDSKMQREVVRAFTYWKTKTFG